MKPVRWICVYLKYKHSRYSVAVVKLFNFSVKEDDLLQLLFFRTEYSTETELKRELTAYSVKCFCPGGRIIF